MSRPSTLPTNWSRNGPPLNSANVSLASSLPFASSEPTFIKPIVGCELYVCKKDDHRAPPEGDTYNHLLVLAENEEGYRNLIKITSEASMHGFYYKPRISKKFLADHSKGLIGLSGCLAGEVCENLLAGKYDAATPVRPHVRLANK